MTYDPNFPQPSTLISQAPCGFQSNWQAINSNTSGFTVDHVTLTDTTNGGRHKAVHLKTQTVDPTTVSDEGSIYTKDLGGPDVELFYRRENNGLISQLTGLPFSATSNGFMRFPNGILMKWGNASGRGITTIPFPTGPNIPVFTTVFQILLSTIAPGGEPNTFVYLTNFTTTQFGVDCTKRISLSAATTPFSYLAIGI